MFAALHKVTLTVAGITVIATGATPVQASITAQARTLNAALAVEVPATASSFPSTAQQGWLIADKDDDDDKKGRRRGNSRDDDRDDDDRDHECGKCKVNLNRAKNLARQAAETANGGLRYYRAEDSMHGPAKKCPYVNHKDYWTFTFLGSRPGSSTMTYQSVVQVYKHTARVVVAYNGPVRAVQQTQFVSFSRSQRTVLVDLMRGTCGCNYLLTDTLRTQIVSQSRSLPPGIQKQLLRGKGLPPGIAKKLIVLPKTVNTYINLPSEYDLAVIGSNIIVLEQVRYTMVDMIASAF
jgi:hypothetical protein